MSLAYRVMYRVGFTPWDTEEVPGELSALVEGEEALPPGRALDVGCGTGTQATYLAGRGWRVSAIDAVERPLRRARARATAAGVGVEWIRADVTRLGEAGLEPGFSLIHDRGCFHGLNEAQRTAYAAAVSALAAPGATLLMMAFARNHVPVGPSGVDGEEIAACFARWELDSVMDDSAPAPSGPMGEVARHWYLLRRGDGQRSR